METTMRKVLFAAAFTLASTLVFSDAGRAHGPKGQAYEGHAAAMGEPGDPKDKRIRTIHVTMTDEMRFLPATIAIVRGETIKFVVKNAGQTKHEFVLGTEDELTKHAAEMEKFPEMEHDDPNSVQVDPGKAGTVLWKFTKPGTWEVGF